MDKSFAESVIQEKRDLDARMDGLMRYICGNTSEKERELGTIQYQAMSTLSTVLLYRINELSKDD
jgi:hypothetical protein